MANGTYAQGGGTPRADGYLEQLIASINDSARTARTAMTTLLIVMIYLGAACLAADHEALLREGAMTIPQVGISLPLVSSFALAPPILLFLHLTLLIQLDLLTPKLRLFNEEIARIPVETHRQSYRHLIFPFAFAQTGLDGWRIANLPMATISWLAMVALPLAVLLVVLVRFLPYQGEILTLMHQIWVVLDCLILWAFHLHRHPLPGMLQRRAGHIAYRWVFLPALIGALGYGVFTQARIPDAGEGDVRRETVDAKDDVRNILDWACWKLGEPRAKQTTEAPKEEKKEKFREIGSNEFACRFIKLTDRTLVQREAPRGLVTKYDGDDEKLKAARQKHAEGLFLRGRQLRYADLRRANLFGADLIGADLRDAQFDQAGLAHAVMRNVQLDGASLLGTVLNGAILVSSEVKDAKLGCIVDKIPNPLSGNAGLGFSCNQLKGANLRSARLQGADLRSARLQGANLFDARLQGADLRDARLQGANLRRLDFKVMTPEQDVAIRKELQTAIKGKDSLNAVLAQLDRGLVSGAKGFPTGISQSPEKTEFFMKDHPVFARWQAPVHGGDSQKYFALLVPQLIKLACTENDSAQGIARRAGSRTARGVPDVPHLAGALLDAPCFKELKLPGDVIDELKKERARQEAAKAAPKR